MQAHAALATRLLIPLLDSPQRDARLLAAKLLGELGPSARAAVPGLTSMLDSDDPLARALAAQSLSRMGPAAAPAVPGLTRQLEDLTDQGEAEPTLLYPTALDGAAGPTLQNQNPAFAGSTGAPGTTRTYDPQVRSLMLYPTELRARARDPTRARPGFKPFRSDRQSAVWANDGGRRL